MATHMTRRGLLAAAGISVAGAATACAPSAKPSSAGSTASGGTTPTAKPSLTSTKVVIMDNVANHTKEQIAKMKAATGCDIQFVQFDQTRLNAMLAAGNPPDAVRGSGVAQTAALAVKKLGQPIDQFIAVSDVVKEDDIAKNEDAWKFDLDAMKQGQGQRYGLSIDYSQDFMLWANKTMFEAAGIELATPDKPYTYQQMLENAAKMTKREGGRALQYGMADLDNLVNFGFLQWVLATYGKSSVSEDGKSLDFTAAESIELMKWWQSALVNKYGPYPDTDPNPDGWSWPPYAAKKMAVMNYGLWATSMLNGDKIRDNTAFMPAYTWGPERISPCQSATGFWIPAKAKNPFGGFKFIEYYCAGEGAIERTKAGGGLTCLTSLMKYLPQSNDWQKKVMEVQNEELKYMKFVNMSNPYLDGWAINDIFKKNSRNFARGQQTPEEFASMVTEKSNAALKDALKRI